MTAYEVCRTVQHLDLEVARHHHVEITEVLTELAADAGISSPWTRHDPTVTLLRALSRLTLRAPEARSACATSLCARLQAPRHAAVAS